MSKTMKRGVTAVIVAVVLAAVFFVIKPGSAQAASQIVSSMIKDQTIASRDIGPDAVGTSELKDGSTYFKNLSKGTQDLINNSTAKNKAQDTKLADLQTQIDEVETTPGEPGEDGKDGVVAPVYGQGTATVADIGGTFGKFPDNVRATILDTVDLPAGKYAVTSEGFFINNQATSGQTRMQLALRVENGTDWGQDLGTCFTGTISPLANRESHCSSTRVVTLTEDSIVKVFGFGYADDQGSADSGKVNATSFVTALPVQ